MLASSPRSSSAALRTGLVYAALAGLHLLLAARMRGPMLFGDETAYLGIARFLAGAGAAPRLVSTGMRHVAFYHPGYPLLLAPAWALWHDPFAAYRAALVLNGFFLAALFPLAAAFARRVLGLAAADAFWVGLATSLYPSFVLQSDIAWTESLLLPLVLAVCLAVHRLAAEPGTGPAVLLGLAAAGTYAVHERTLCLVPLTAIALGWLRVRGRLRSAAAGAGIAALAAGFGAVRLLDASLVPRLWPGAPLVSEASFAARLLDPAQLAAAALALAGQLWILTVASAGLFTLGAVMLTHRALHGEREAERATALFTLAAAAGLLFTSSLFTTTFDRVDKIIYGRYAETFLAPFLAAGLAALFPGAPRRRWPGLLAALALLPAALLLVLFAGHGKAAFSGIYNQLNLFGIEALILRLGGLRMLRITLVGTAAALALFALGRRRPRRAAVLAGALFLAGALYTERSWLVLLNQNVLATVRLPAAVRRLGAVREICYDESRFTYAGFFAYPFWLSDVRFRFFAGDREPPPCLLVISGPDFDRTRPAARLLFRETGTEQALWQMPGGAIPGSAPGAPPAPRSPGHPPG